MNCFAIPKINFNQNRIADFDDLWNLQIISDYSQPQIFAIRILAHDANGRLLYNAKSENFLLQPGIYNVDRNSLTGVNIAFVIDNSLQTPAEQEISVRVLLVNPQNNTEVYQYADNLILQSQNPMIEISQDSSSGKKSGKLKKYVQFGGALDLNGNYNNREDTLFYLPFDYFRLKLNSQLSIAEVPFTYDMYITTEQKFTSQQLNSYSFQFDYQTFKSNLVKKTSERMGKLLGNTASINQFLNDPQNPFEHYDVNSLLDSLKSRKILDQSFVDKYREYTELDTIKKMLQITGNVELKKYTHLLVSELKKVDTSQLDSILTTLVKLDSLRNKGDSLYKKGEGYYTMLADIIQKGTSQDFNKLYTSLLKIDKYSLSDLGKLDKLEDFVKDKVDQFKYQDQLKRIEELKQLPGKDIHALMEDKNLRSIAQKYGLITRKEELLSGIRNLGLGTVYPYYTQYSINGIILNGYNLSYQYRKFYIGAAGGKLVNSYSDSLLQDRQVDKNNLFGFVIGYGSKQKTHLHMHYQYGVKKLSSLDSLSSDRRNIYNYVITPELKLVLFKDRLQLVSEGAVSYTRSLDVDSINIQQTGIWGYALHADVLSRISGSTDLKGRAEYVSDNFTSFGVPYLNRNYLLSEIKISQQIKDYVELSAGYRFDKYFINGETTFYDSDIHSVSVGARARYKIMDVNLVYTPGWIRTDSMGQNKIFFSNVISSLGASYKVKEISMRTQTGFLYNSFFQNQLQVIEDGSVNILNRFDEISRSMNVYVVQTMSFSNKIMLVKNFSFIKNNFFATQNKNILIFNLHIQHSVSKRVRYTVGVQFTRVLKQNLRTMIQTSWDINVNKYFLWYTRVQYDYLNGIERESFYNTHGFQLNTGVRLKI